MNPELVNKIADAVLYEGYMLYPYRASAVKNQQRFNFGVLMPESYSVVQKGSERSMTQTECLIKGAGDFEIDIKVRFLHLCEREVFEKRSDGFERVDSLDAGGERFQSWQEAIEREVEFLNVKFDDSNLRFRTVRKPRKFRAATAKSPVRSSGFSKKSLERSKFQARSFRPLKLIRFSRSRSGFSIPRLLKALQKRAAMRLWHIRSLQRIRF